MKNVVFLVVCLLIVVGMVIGGMYFSYSNKEIQLRNLAAAQGDANKAIFDKVWKVIAQKAQVTDKYKDGFKEVYNGIMSGRYGKKDKVVFDWIKEQNPNFDSSLYKSLMDTIEGQREEFAQIQVKLRDIKREHDNLRTLAPSSWFIGNRPELKVVIVTSDKTEDAFTTGKENNIDL